MEFWENDVVKPVKKAVDLTKEWWSLDVIKKDLEEPKQKEITLEKPVVETKSIFNLDKIKFIESGGKGYNKDGSFIINKVGAVGPYQIIPKMAKNPGYNIKGIDVMNSTEEQHRAYATDYLTKSLEYFKKTYPNKTNHKDMAIASYNYGISATEKVLKKHGNLHWKEHLPKETKNYLKKYYN